MRRSREQHVSLFRQYSKHEFSEELQKISDLLDRIPEVLELVLNDLANGKDPRGAKGMSAEEVLRAGILKQQNEWTYKELEFNLVDSSSARAFVRLRDERGYSDSCLQENIKKISSKNWETLNQSLVRMASSDGVEKGRVVRMDSTTVETQIQYPRDSNLIVDCLRVVSRICFRIHPRLRMKFTLKQGRKLMLLILGCKNKEERRPHYEKLIIGAGDVWLQLPQI